MSIALIVHGGAGNIPADSFEGFQVGCTAAATIGWQVLRQGGHALDVVEAAVRALENNPQFNAGTGSCLNRAGNIEMDAGIMDGSTLQVGAIAGVELIKNPISLARRVLMSEHAMLIGKGTQSFAKDEGIPLCRFEDLLTERQYNAWKDLQSGSPTTSMDTQDESEQKHGTVGAVAIDSEGRLAAATSTGGMINKYQGRIGDSPLVGCGFYADEYAAISCTGYGEDFIRLMIAQRAASYVAQGASAQEAAEAAMSFLSQHASGTGGLIVVDRHGHIGKAKNSPQLACAYIEGQMETPIAAIE
jgi:beta-aspartyl-peptidase (threonine type)